jgi:glyoxylase-like metal-dependent hydrolase (beta-lactamase superfamily II)
MSAGYPSDDKSNILESSIPLERTRFLISSDFNMSIGPFPRALDFYGDGSVYIIDTPGHCAGHINILARTSDNGSWIYLGGDTAHDVRLLTGEKEIATVDQHGAYRCAHANKAQAVEDIRRVAALLMIPRVQVIVAHDWRWYDNNKNKEPESPFLPGKIATMS